MPSWSSSPGTPKGAAIRAETPGVRRAFPAPALLASLALAGCTGPALTPGTPAGDLWRPPPVAAAPEQLRVVPAHAVARVGEIAQLRVEGALAPGARCVLLGRESEPPPRIEVPSPATPGVVDVLCSNGEVLAAGQVTFTDAWTLPLRDPYAGGVALFKLRDLPRRLLGAAGTQRTGRRDLDARLVRLGAWALAAFPFASAQARDEVGIGRWIAVDIPAGTNFYQAVSLLRASPEVEPQSYWPADGDFLRVRARSDWPSPLVSPDPDRAIEAGRPVAGRGGAVRLASYEPDPKGATRDLRAIRAQEAWRSHSGRGVSIAVIDTGLDVNHVALAPNVISKASERGGRDADGNGVPGDESGVNLAHLALARGDDGPPFLGLGVASDLSDWDGAEQRDAWGHGTQIASIAAGAGGPGVRLGVAPRARLIVVDVQENLRASSSRLHHADPRMRERGEAQEVALRSPLWARAAGVVYAVTERARVLTCAWSEDTPHWLLRDALLYAEDNCAIPVCAVDEPPGPVDSYPAQWRRAWLTAEGASGGSVVDLWTGEQHEDFFERPLTATIVAGSVDRRGRPSGEADLVRPDLYAPTGGPGKRGGVVAAVSNPRNDASPGPDHRMAPFRGPAAASGVIAGTAALVSGLRPDLEPAAVREALILGATPRADRPVVDVVGALRAAQNHDTGTCHDRIRERTPGAVADDDQGPWWKRIEVDGGVDAPGLPPTTGPASPGP